jgi:uncharacterized protein YndB with AHSA1/START domain
MADTLSVTVSITVLKSAKDVFAAVLTPTPFFVKRASGPLTAGKSITWEFPEVAQPLDVVVENVVPDETVRFQWGSQAGGLNTVDIALASLDEHGRAAAKKAGLDPGTATTVTITESGWPDTPEGRKLSYGNQFGWTQYLCALKAHLEHGVNLRRGAFLHHRF